MTEGSADDEQQERGRMRVSEYCVQERQVLAQLRTRSTMSERVPISKHEALGLRCGPGLECSVFAFATPFSPLAAAA